MNFINLRDARDPVESLGVGESRLAGKDADGTKAGYDLEMAPTVK